MELDKLYKLQEELDKTILKNEVKRTGKEIDKDLLLSQTILALQVEVAELANATRCFKHWSKKGPEPREKLLDEYADVWHFYLSIGNQLGIKLDSVDTADYTDLTVIFLNIYEETGYLYCYTGGAVGSEDPLIEITYERLGRFVRKLGYELGFTEKQIEQAYMKKHKENYRRQEEGY